MDGLTLHVCVCVCFFFNKKVVYVSHGIMPSNLLLRTGVIYRVVNSQELKTRPNFHERRAMDLVLG